MSSIELSATVKALKVERAKLQSGVSKLDQAVSALEGITGTNPGASSGNGQKRTLSAAARNKIAKALKLPWAKITKERVAKQ